MHDLEHDDETVVISSLLKWLPHSSAETHKLEQVQRRAAKFVHSNYTERTPGCVTNMVQNLAIHDGSCHKQQMINNDKLNHGKPQLQL
jgi:hypothetical protein